MRHLNRFNQLSRTHSHRKALLSNLACSLILHKRIKTTYAKARELRKYIEPILTRSKDVSNDHSVRVAHSKLRNKEASKGTI